MSHLSLHSQPVIWAVALLANRAGAELPPEVGEAMTVRFDGLDIPVLQSVLAVVGVLLARRLVPPGTEEISRRSQIIVTVLMLLVALAWVSESHPGILFSLIVSIGLGFSGYSLIELMGSEIKAFVKRAFDTAGGFLDRLGGKK